MAVLTPTHPTASQSAKLKNPDGTAAYVIEILEEKNDFLAHMPYEMANDGTSHVVTLRDSVPTPDWFKPGYGILPKFGTFRQIPFRAGAMRSVCEIPKDLVSSDMEEMKQQAKAHIQGMNNEMANAVFYGNQAVNDNQFTGLTPWYDKKTFENKDAIIDAGGTGSNLRSIWVIGWGPETVAGFYPSNRGEMGIQVDDMGLTDDQTADVEGNSSAGKVGRQPVFRTYYSWSLGVSLKDWRYCIRIANLDPQDYKEVPTGTEPKLLSLVNRALVRLRDRRGISPAIYADRNTIEWMSVQRTEKVAQSTLTQEDVFGRGMVTVADGVPVYPTDALAVNEGQVS